MVGRSALLWLGLLAWVAVMCGGALGMSGKESLEEAVRDAPAVSVGNILYSVVGFVLGGSLMFVSLFDPTRRPVVDFFDGVIGTSTPGRRRREGIMGYGLDGYVATAFDTLTAALDKFETLAMSIKGH